MFPHRNHWHLPFLLAINPAKRAQEAHDAAPFCQENTCGAKRLRQHCTEQRGMLEKEKKEKTQHVLKQIIRQEEIQTGRSITGEKEEKGRKVERY